MTAKQRAAIVEARMERVKGVLATAEVELTITQVQLAVHDPSFEGVRYALDRLVQRGEVVTRRAFVATRAVYSSSWVFRLAAGTVAAGGGVIVTEHVADDGDRHSRTGLGLKDDAEVKERIAAERAGKVDRGERPSGGWVVPQCRDRRFH